PVGRAVPGVSQTRAVALPCVTRLPVGFSPHKPYLDLLLLVTALRAARRFRPDVVHGHLHEGTVVGAALARRGRRPLVADLQGSLTGELTDHGTLSPSGPVTRAARRLARAILRRPSRSPAS